MPATLRYVDTDTATVYERGADGKKKRLASLFWGDQVKVIGKSAGDWKLDFTTRVWDATKKKYIWKKHDAFMDDDVAFRDISPPSRPPTRVCALFEIALERSLIFFKETAAFFKKRGCVRCRNGPAKARS